MWVLLRRLGLAIATTLTVTLMPWIAPTARSAVTNATVSSNATYTVIRRMTIGNPSSHSMPVLQMQAPLLNMGSLNDTVTLTAISAPPVAVTNDSHGNQLGIFRIPSLPPHSRITITFRYTAEVRAVRFDLKNVSGSYLNNSLYTRYTNPQYGLNEGIDTNAPAIATLVQRLLKNVVNPAAKAQILFRWIAKNIRYNYSMKPSGNALATLRTRTGICTDYAALYVSMLRTAHIPARLIGGYLSDPATGTAAFHDWVQLYLPHAGWVSADPTWGAGYFADIGDVYHIPLYLGLEPYITIYGQKAGSQGPTVTTAFTVSHQTHPPRLLTTYNWSRLPFEPVWVTRLSEWMLN